MITPHGWRMKRYNQERSGREKLICGLDVSKKKKAAHEHIEARLKEKVPINDLKPRIKNLTKEVDQLIEQGKFPKGVVLDDHASTSMPLVTTGLVGQSSSENISSVLSWLNQDDARVIGIHGMGGVGKTTLMKHIHNKLLEDYNFDIICWVTASQDCSLLELQNKIGTALGLDGLSEYNNERRKAALFRRFSQLRKCVLFLDDLWESYSTEDIGIPLNVLGCNLIFSTRSMDVCNRMNCHKTIKIVPFSKPDSMKLFVETLGAPVPTELMGTAEMIVDECGGLPLALKVIASCMRGKDDVHEWENVLCELSTPEFSQVSMEEEVFRVLKFSYNNLEDKKRQDCFLSCALFPEDHNIDKHDLVRLWINEGIFDELKSHQDKVNRGQTILNMLERSCLLEAAPTFYESKRCVKMHDLIRDMAINITQNSPRFLVKSGTNLKKVPEKEKWSEDLLKVSLGWNHIRVIRSDLAPMTRKLSVLLLNDNPLKEIPESFFVCMRELRVLDLSNTKLVKLLDSVSEMKNLRALSLRNCYELTFIPSLAGLTNLRVLDLQGDKLLRPLSGLEELEKLEELTYCPWNVNDISGFCRLLNSNPSLRCFRFLLTSSGTCAEYARQHTWEHFLFCEKTVWISNAEFCEDEIVLLPYTIESLRVEKSVMKGRRRLADVFPSLGVSANLKHMCVQKCKGLEYIISSSSSSSSSPQLDTCIWAPLETLEKLELKALPDFKRIAEFGRCSFPKLKTLDIHKCPKIKEVFPLTNHRLRM